jgi:hypothetical protein
MSRRDPIQYASISHKQINGRGGDGGRGGTGTTTTVIGGSGQVVTNASAIIADLVDVNETSRGGLATHVDNTELVGGEIILVASPGTPSGGLGSSGEGYPYNHLWRVPALGEAWVRYREDLHRRGMTVVVKGGAASARGATGSNVDFGGYAGTTWVLDTEGPYDLDTDYLVFRQMPTSDGAKMNYSGGTLALPAASAGIEVPFDSYEAESGEGIYSPPLHFQNAAGEVVARYSGLYYVDISLKCSAAAAQSLVVQLWIDGANYQEVIATPIGTTVQRYHAGCLVRLAGDGQEFVSFAAIDPTGTGYNLTVAAGTYMNIHLVARR